MNDDKFSRRVRAETEEAYQAIYESSKPAVRKKPPTHQDIDRAYLRAVDFAEAARPHDAGVWVAEEADTAEAAREGRLCRFSFQSLWLALVQRYREELLALADGSMTHEAFRKLVVGDAGAERKRLEASIAQAARAKNARTDALQKIIFEIIKGKPEADVGYVWRQLEKCRGHGVIDTVDGDKDDGCIEWTDRTHETKDTSASALKRRISRAKKGR